MRKQVEAAADWTRKERKRLGWSFAELAARAQDMASDMGWEGWPPGEADIEALEAAQARSVPRWFKLVRYAVERAAVPDAAALGWLAERNAYWQTGEPLRISRPLLFEEEDRILRKLQKLDTDEQRAIRAFVSDYADRQCYAEKEEMARKLLERLGIFVAGMAGAAPDEDVRSCPG